MNLTDEVVQSTSGDSNGTGEEPCPPYEYPAYLDERFWLVSVFGTSVALLSVVENLFLFFMLVRRRQHRNSHCLYLLLLAFFDVFIGAAYVPLMSLSLLVDYLQSIFLLRAWYWYMVPMITISHAAMTASSFLIVAASFERYCITCWTSRVRFVNKYRRWIASGAVALGFITKCTLAGEFKITYNEDCAGTMNEWSLTLSEMALNEHYNLLWRIGFRNVVTVLFPFFLLLVMNLKIVSVIRTSQFELISSGKLSEMQRKRRVRAATRTLLMIVFTYLLANVLNVILTFWEYIDIKSLTENFLGFYTFGVDTVSILTILAGVLRLPIYVTCMPQLRKEFITFFERHLSNETTPYKEQRNVSSTFGYASTMILRISQILLKHTELSHEQDYDSITDDDSSEVFL